MNSRSYRLGALSAVLFFIILYLVTVPGNTGDTTVYVGDILRYSQSPSPSFLWEFGHLLWRPLGLVLWELTRPLLAWWFQGNPVIEITAVLFALDILSGIAITLLTFDICRRLGLTNLPAVTIVAAILLSNAFFNVHSGTAYIPGLAFNMVGFWLVLKAVQDRRNGKRDALLAGLALALSCAFWFPYFVAIPAALAVVAIAGFSSDRESAPPLREWMPVLTSTVIAAIAFGLVIFAFGALMRQISSFSQLWAWILNSGHGIQVQRRYLRFPTGITRAFLFLGEEGTTIKRFVFHDPYAPVRWIDLFGAGLWKVIVVFIGFCALFWGLVRNHKSRLALFVLLAGVLPTFAFALFIFDTGQPERYLSLYPALIVGIAAVFVQKIGTRAPRWILTLFLCVMAVVNLKAYAWDLRVSANASSQRVKLVHQYAGHGGVALILSFNDPLSTYFQRSPFDPENRPYELSLYHVIEPELKNALQWPTGASCRMLQAWTDGGEVWLSKRLVAPRPQPDWEWVENDVKGLHWSDVYAFFSSLHTDAAIGGADGFLRVAKTPENRIILQRSCGARLSGEPLNSSR